MKAGIEELRWNSVMTGICTYLDLKGQLFKHCVRPAIIYMNQVYEKYQSLSRENHRQPLVSLICNKPNRSISVWFADSRDCHPNWLMFLNPWRGAEMIIGKKPSVCPFTLRITFQPLPKSIYSLHHYYFFPNQ